MVIDYIVIILKRLIHWWPKYLHSHKLKNVPRQQEPIDTMKIPPSEIVTWSKAAKNIYQIWRRIRKRWARNTLNFSKIIMYVHMILGFFSRDGRPPGKSKTESLPHVTGKKRLTSGVQNCSRVIGQSATISEMWSFSQKTTDPLELSKITQQFLKGRYVQPSQPL